VRLVGLARYTFSYVQKVTLAESFVSIDLERADAMPIQRSNDPVAFADFEQQGWSDVISGYVEHLGPITLQTVAPTLKAAQVVNGDLVLDVCTGHGILAGAAAQLGAIVRGLDFSEQVLAIARRLYPAIKFDQGDAQALPYPTDSFDTVLCGYGLIHLPEPERALAEMHRVVKPGGRIAVSVWARPAPGNGFALLFGAIRTHGRLEVPLPHGPDFFQFSDETSMTAALSDIGFADARAVKIDQSWHLEQASGFIDGILRGSVRARALLNGQESNAFQAIAGAVEQGLEAFAHERGYLIPMPAIVGSGRKAGRFQVSQGPLRMKVQSLAQALWRSSHQQTPNVDLPTKSRGAPGPGAPSRGPKMSPAQSVNRLMV
jgi:SAM-dependent methyltransferase